VPTDKKGIISMSIERVLVADDEQSIAWVLAKALTKKGFKVDIAADGAEAKALAERNKYDLAILDIKMPDISGLDLLTLFREEQPEMPVIIMTAEATMKNAVEAMKRGAYDYITKPFDLDTLDAIIFKAQKASTASAEIQRLKDELKDHYHLDRAIIGKSPPMQEIYKILGRVAPADVTVLITGESGTGKELVARAIQQPSFGQSLSGPQLRRHPQRTAGKRVVRLRKRCLHRRYGPQNRQIRTGQRRHAVPR
jgi:two-component system nitrogen regulation response regulator GlnG